MPEQHTRSLVIGCRPVCPIPPTAGPRPSAPAGWRAAAQPARADRPGALNLRRTTTGTRTRSRGRRGRRSTRGIPRMCRWCAHPHRARPCAAAQRMIVGKAASQRLASLAACGVAVPQRRLPRPVLRRILLPRVVRARDQVVHEAVKAEQGRRGRVNDDEPAAARPTSSLLWIAALFSYRMRLQPRRWSCSA